MKPSTGTKSLTGLFFVCSLLVIDPTRADATPAQRHILAAGINLGWAVGSLTLLDNRNPTIATELAGALRRAIAHVQTAASLFEEPYRTSRATTDQRVVNKIQQYFTLAPRMSLAQRRAHVVSVWSMYRQSFDTTFHTQRGYHYYGNCDFFTLDAGYHLGRGHIATGVQGSRFRSYQSGANGDLRQAVRKGLQVAIDGYPPGNASHNVLKACCSFGRPDQWWPLVSRLKSNSPNQLYHETNLALQRITETSTVMIRRGNQLVSRCGGKTCPTGWEMDQHGKCKKKCTGSGKWVQVNNSDCTGHDVSETNGPSPDPLILTRYPNAKVAICWDGVTIKHRHRGGAFCTYKTVSPCSGGSNPGKMYVRRPTECPQ